MKNTYLFIVFFLCSIVFFSCTGSSVQEKDDTLKVVADTVKVKSVLVESAEYIDVDSVRINAILPMVSTRKLLYVTLGKPDSIAIPDTINYCITNDKPFKYGYFKGSKFEMYGDTVEMITLAFTKPGTTLTAGKLTLSSNTTLAEIARIFPYAFKVRTNLLVDGQGEVIAITVETGKIPSDYRWMLMFKNGKLVGMDISTSC